MVDKKELFANFQKDWQKHYELDVLKQRDYTRQKCKECDRHFWARIERETCGDSACVGYEFIGSPGSNKKLSYTDTWKEISKYFTSNDHTEIKPYPVVARWRDDLYFTIASINDFQPYVVNGEMPPPANPLIVPQPCIRFSDMTNVGITGRHSTNFVMFGQCAFNNKKTGDFYWKNEAIEHDINYLTQALGLNEDDLAFKEDVWLGGGNFGPSLEYFCKGIELGNCVFMQYESLANGTSRELETKVIDMGAGLSRLCWITHGTPTSYDLVFGSVIDKMKKNTGVKVEKDLLNNYAKLSGIIDIEDGRTLQTEGDFIASKLGVEKSEMLQKLNPLFSLYATADHLKTVLLAITDGQLPSNMGGGYNLRLVLRRAFGFNDDYNFNLDWASIITGHANHLKPLFPHLGEGVSITIDVVDEELKKYRTTQEKAKGKVTNLVIKAAKDNRQITVEELKTLYVSDGIPPETVEAVAKSHDLKLKIPSDFYSSVRHLDEEISKKDTLDVLGLEKTKMLCYDKLEEFESKIIAIKDDWIILDKTGFYAESGGQISDDGKLGGQDILKIKKEAGVVLHRVKDPKKFKVSEIVKGIIKMDKREQITSHHTGAHILNIAARDVLGMHVWQCGSNKDEFKAHLDLTHYKRITDEELDQIEFRANQIISQNLKVINKIYARDEAESKFGFRIYQGGAVPGLEIRIISIANLDHQACGGTHVDRTGDIGLFKVVKRESVQDGVERVTFKCQLAAVRYIQEREKVIKTLANELSIPQKQIVPSVLKFFDEWKERGKKLSKLEEELSANVIVGEIKKAKDSKKDTIELSNLTWATKKVDLAAKQIVDAGLIAILSSNEKFIVVAVPTQSDKNALEILKSKGAKGGGSKDIARGKLV